MMSFEVTVLKDTWLMNSNVMLIIKDKKDFELFVSSEMFYLSLFLHISLSAHRSCVCYHHATGQSQQLHQPLDLSLLQLIETS